MFRLKTYEHYISTSNFHPPEVVGCGSETQLQVGENLNKILYMLKDLRIMDGSVRMKC